MTGQLSKRAQSLPPYATARIAAIKQRMVAQGRDVIDLSIGDSDSPPPEQAVRALAEAVRDPAMSRYAHQVGLRAFRESVARYMDRRFGVAVDPGTEILPLIGSKEGLAHLALAVLDPGDVCVVPEPGYPAYRGGAVFAGADPEIYPLRPDTGFLVELEELPAARLDRTRLAYLNYPNNPTAAVAPQEYLERTVGCCRERGIVLAYDNPYCEITFDGYEAPSILEMEGARETAIEFHSMSKTFHMTGWRVGWAVGNAELIAGLSKVKSWLDTGVFLAVQHAAAATLDAAETIVPGVRAHYQTRRDAAVSALRDVGFDVTAPKATMYLWIPLPDRVSSIELAERALEEEAVATLPGGLLGGGDGFLRLALTVDESRFREGAGRLARAMQAVGARG